MEEDRHAQLNAFMEWLRERRLTGEKRVPHYARWVECFLRFRGTRPSEEWQDSLRVFLEELAADSWRPNWQTQQAGEAVGLYFGQFRVGQDTPVSGEGDRGLVGHAEALAEMERLLQLRHYAPRTQRSYLGWARRFLTYVDPKGMRHPDADDVSAFLSHLATVGKVAASTQNQAFHGLLFLCRFVLDIDLSHLADTVRARRGPKLPVVLSPDETRAVLQQLSGTSKLMLGLLYGAGLRVGELVTLRIKDIDFGTGSVTVRAAKGDKDRVTTLPRRLVESLQAHLARVKELHARDLAAGAGEVALPDALARKYPRASREWPWQFAFPSQKLDVMKGMAPEVRSPLDELQAQMAAIGFLKSSRLPLRPACGDSPSHASHGDQGDQLLLPGILLPTERGVRRRLVEATVLQQRPILVHGVRLHGHGVRLDRAGSRIHDVEPRGGRAPLPIPEVLLQAQVRSV